MSSKNPVRKFKSISAAKDVARMSGKSIAWKAWSDKEQCMLVIFGDYEYQSNLMRASA